jgi:transcriptional regulator with XRE-family HTH domain
MTADSELAFMTSGHADTGALIGSRIARARRELGLTQAALADRIGTSLGILNRYETGGADPEPVLERIAAATGKSVQWFISGSEAASDTSGELAPPIEQATSTAGGPPVTESVAAEGQAQRSAREEESPPTPAGESVVESGAQSLEQRLQKTVDYSPTAAESLFEEMSELERRIDELQSELAAERAHQSEKIDRTAALESELQQSRQGEAALAERLERAEAELDRYRQQEHSMAEALVLAKQTAAQVVESLVNGSTETSNGRRVFKFRLEVDQEATPTADRRETVLEQNRLIPRPVKLQVWKRDGGRCVECGSTDNLHFDHIIPHSRGGSSLVAKNIQLLCARHNSAKHDRIE